VWLIVDRSQCKDNNNYYYSFKIKLESRPKVGPNHMSRGSTQVNLSQDKIKLVIIIVLKLDLMVNLGQGLGHEPRGSTWVDIYQCKDKSCYFHNFKNRPGQDLSHGSEGSIWVDSSKHTNKNSCYHSFKTWFKSRLEVRFRSQGRDG